MYFPCPSTSPKTLNYVRVWYYGTPGHLGARKDCPDYWGALILGVEDVLWQNIESHLVPVACVHNRGVSAIIQGCGLDELHCAWLPLIQWNLY